MGESQYESHNVYMFIKSSTLYTLNLTIVNYISKKKKKKTSLGFIVLVVYNIRLLIEVRTLSGRSTLLNV